MIRNYLALVIFATLAAGCGSSGPTTYPVQGIVRFSDNTVVRGGSIEFENSDGKEPILARGEIGPDGTFVLGTFGLDDGAVEGTHRIAVFSEVDIGNGYERPGLIQSSQVHPRYQRFRTSGLVEKVSPGENAFAIEVEHAPVEN